MTEQGAIITPTTDANGDQVFADVPVGEAKVYLTYPNSAFDGIFFDATGAESADGIECVPNESTSAYSSAVVTVEVGADGAAIEVGFTALRAAAEVEYENGAPVSDVTVELGSGDTWYPATEYDFAGGEGLDTVDAGSYFSAPTFVVTLEEIPTASVDVTYFLDVELDGVYESGADTTVPGAEVYLRDAAGDWWATTSLDGTYAFSGVAPGAATVYVEIPANDDTTEIPGLPGLELPEAALAVWDATGLESYRDVVEAETTTISFEGSMINADGTTSPIVVDDVLVGEIAAELVADVDGSDAADSDVAQVFVGGALVLQTAAVVDTTTLGSVPGAGVEFLANDETAAGEELLAGSGAFLATDDDGEVAIFGAAEYGIRPTVPARYQVVEVVALNLDLEPLEVTEQQTTPATARGALFAAGTEYRVDPAQVGGPLSGIVWAVAVAPITVTPPVLPGVDEPGLGLPPTVGLPAAGPAVLPATGSDVNVWALVFGAGLLLAAGLGARLVVRTRRTV